MITDKVPLTFCTNQNEIGLHDFTHFVLNRRTVGGNDYSTLHEFIRVLKKYYKKQK